MSCRLDKATRCSHASCSPLEHSHSLVVSAIRPPTILSSKELLKRQPPQLLQPQSTRSSLPLCLSLSLSLSLGDERERDARQRQRAAPRAAGGPTPPDSAEQLVRVAQRRAAGGETLGRERAGTLVVLVARRAHRCAPLLSRVRLDSST